MGEEAVACGGVADGVQIEKGEVIRGEERGDALDKFGQHGDGDPEAGSVAHGEIDHVDDAGGAVGGKGAWRTGGP